jgi:hypothetical protein
MRTVADFRRAAVAGSVWHCTNNVHPQVSGERRITGGTNRIRFTGTKADGSEFGNGAMDIPKRADVRIEGDSITWLNDADGSDGYTWTLIRDAAPVEPAEETTTQQTAPPNATPVCCGKHADRCKFGRPHVWATWYENGRLVQTPDTYRCDGCGGVCTADEPDEPAPAAPEEAPADQDESGQETVADGATDVTDPVKAEAKRVVRTFQRYTPEQRANRAASHRLTYAQRTAVGEFFFTHPDLPGRSFDTRHGAARATVNEATARELDARVAAGMSRRAEMLARPDIAALAARVAALTDEERRHLHAAYLPHFRMYRPAQSSLSHRCSATYSDAAGDPYRFRDVFYVAAQAAGAIEYERDDWGAREAADDYAKVLLWGDLLADHERPVFTGPWVAVIGEGGPRAELPERTEAYVSPWETV